MITIEATSPAGTGVLRSTPGEGIVVADLVDLFGWGYALRLVLPPPLRHAGARGRVRTVGHATPDGDLAPSSVSVPRTSVEVWSEGDDGWTPPVTPGDVVAYRIVIASAHSREWAEVWEIRVQHTDRIEPALSLAWTSPAQMSALAEAIWPEEWRFLLPAARTISRTIARAPRSPRKEGA